MKTYIIHFIKCFIGSKYLYISGMQPHRVTNELQNHNIAPLFRRKQIPEIPYNNVIKIIYLTFVSISRRVYSFVPTIIAVVNDNIREHSKIISLYFGPSRPPSISHHSHVLVLPPHTHV